MNFRKFYLLQFLKFQRQRGLHLGMYFICFRGLRFRIDMKRTRIKKSYNEYGKVPQKQQFISINLMKIQKKQFNLKMGQHQPGSNKFLQVKESIKKQTKKALCSPQNFEPDDQVEQRKSYGSQQTTLLLHYASFPGKMILPKNVFESMKQFWAFEQDDFDSGLLTDFELQKLKEINISDQEQLYECQRQKESVEIQLIHLQERLNKKKLYLQWQTLLKPIQYPLRNFNEDILLEYLPTWFQMNLASNQQYNEETLVSEKDLGEDCIEFMLNTEDSDYSQLLIELRWSLVAQLISRQQNKKQLFEKIYFLSNVKEMHILLLIIYSFVSLIINHCQRCQLILNSIPSSSLKLQIYSYFWNSYQGTMYQFQKLLTPAFISLEKCYSHFYTKPIISPTFSVPNTMAKIWGQLNPPLISLFESLLPQIIDTKLLCKSFNDLCDQLVNEHSVNWFGHTQAHYPKELIDFMQKIEVLNLQNIYRGSQLGIRESFKIFQEQMMLQKSIFGDIMSEIFLLQPQLNALKEIFKLEMKQQITKITAKTTSVDIDPLAENDKLLVQQENDRTNIIENHHFIEEIMQSVFDEQQQQQQANSSILNSILSSSVSTQPSSVIIFQQQQFNLKLKGYEKIEHIQLLRQLQDVQTSKQVNCEMRNRQIENRNQLLKISFDLNEEVFELFCFQKKLSMIKIFQHVQLKNQKEIMTQSSILTKQEQYKSTKPANFADFVNCKFSQQK